MENAGFLLGLERLHPPRRNQVDLKGGPGWGALLGVGNTWLRRLLVFVEGEVGVLVGRFMVVVVGFFLACLGAGGREVCFLQPQMCDVCSVHVDGQMVETPQ